MSYLGLLIDLTYSYEKYNVRVLKTCSEVDDGSRDLLKNVNFMSKNSTRDSAPDNKQSKSCRFNKPNGSLPPSMR